MRKFKYMGPVLAGLGAGTVTGLLGGGGGMVLVPLLSLLVGMDDNEVFPSSVAIILPICVVSLVCTALQGELPWVQALPYLIGSGIGGFIGGKWGCLVPVKWLHRTLGILILWGGVRYLC